MQVTTWFLAREDEAEDIESIVTTEEHSPEDWPHIELPLILMELMALSAALRGEEDVAAEDVLEKELIEREDLIVARVKDSFIRALAGVAPGTVPALAETWAETMDQDDHEPDELHEILASLSDFARQAIARKSPVLLLSTF